MSHTQSELNLNVIRAENNLRVAKDGRSLRETVKAETALHLARRWANRGLDQAVKLASAYAQASLNTTDAWERARVETEAQVGKDWLQWNADEIVELVHSADASVRESIVRDLLGA